MPAHFQVELDNSFVEICVKIINQGNEFIDDLVSHPAGQKIHAHAIRFGNTSESVDVFWKNIVQDSFNQEVGNRIINALEYIEDNENLLTTSLSEVAQYLPENIRLNCKLYTMTGYDIGIVSEGSAFINVAHPLFKSDPCELIFMSMHEVHHVGYTHYNPIFSISDLKRLSNLKAAIRYSTHLEGLAVYAPLARRLESGCIAHEDYSALTDQKTAEQRIDEYFMLVRELENEKDRVITVSDFKIFEPMSAVGKRLWYVSGAHMAKRIDEEIGRDALIETVKLGSDRFFALYDTEC
ncbi:MAG: DUF5700 domain-containing putative Zn-dependent protease [Candidatus Thorarchaeota archaeon]